jgi:hypothetical protein
MDSGTSNNRDATDYMIVHEIADLSNGALALVVKPEG